jgi:hypothetical protein
LFRSGATTSTSVAAEETLHPTSNLTVSALTLSKAIVYYTFYDFDGLKMTNAGQNTLPYNKLIVVHISCADGI